MSDITKLRSILFDTLQDLRNPQSNVDLERVKLINDTAKNLVDTAKVEVDFMRVTGNTNGGSGFLAVPASPQIGGNTTATGIKTVTESKPGVTVTQHRMR